MEDCEIEAERLKSLIYASGVDLELQGYYCRIEEAIKNFEFQAKSVSRKYSQRPKITKESESEEDLEKAVVKLVNSVDIFVHVLTKI